MDLNREKFSLDSDNIKRNQELVSMEAGQGDLSNQNENLKVSLAQLEEQAELLKNTKLLAAPMPPRKTDKAPKTKNRAGGHGGRLGRGKIVRRQISITDSKSPSRLPTVRGRHFLQGCDPTDQGRSPWSVGPARAFPLSRRTYKRPFTPTLHGRV